MANNKKKRKTEEEWLDIKDVLSKKQLSILEAKADKFFETDEEMPLSKHIILLTIVFAVFFLIVWAWFAELDEVTRGDGKIIPSSEVQVVQNLEGGIVEQFFVKEGDEVKAGQALMQLRDVSAASDLGSNTARYYGLMAAITRLQAEAEGKDVLEFPENVIEASPESVKEEMNTFNANKSRLQGQLRVLEEQLSQKRQEVSELTRKISDLENVISLSKEEKAMIEPLVKRGSAPKVELLQLERGIKEKETELNGVKLALPRSKSAVLEAQARINEVKKTAQAEAQAELSTKLIEMNSIKETLSALKDRKTRTEIKSPVNGTVKDIKINTVGGVVKPGEPLMEIVPRDDQLLVEARIKPSDIAFLYPGQKAVVKITAYDFSIYGGLDGELVDISADSITDENGESFYRVKISTYENSLKRKGEVLPIKPGMVASVDIMTGKKTVLDYLLKPFKKTLDNSLGER